MKMLRRALATVAVVILSIPSLAAHADEASTHTPVRRISCPSVEEVSRASGYELSSLTATKLSCWYASGPEVEPAQRHRVEFTYTKDSDLDAARSRVEAWGSTAIRDVPTLGPGAFSWESAGTANIYWDVSPGAVGTLSGVNHARALASAALFRPQMEVYTVPGERNSGGRQWRTTCEPYSETTRCRTEIWADVIVPDGDGFRRHRGWTFNSLTYLWAKPALWKDNPLATDGMWRADGKLWRTECHTAVTGRGACRTWLHQPTVETGPDGQPLVATGWVFNNQVLFS